MSMRRLGLALLVCLPMSAAAGQEAEQPMALYRSLRETINHGADLFNIQADYAGCYRLYQGSLLAIKPFLTPESRRAVEGALTEAETMPVAADKAYRLRTAIDAVREQLRPFVVEVIAVPPTRVK